MNDEQIYSSSDDVEIKLEESTFADGSHVVPQIKTTWSKDFIPWGDNLKNDYPDHILMLFNNSALHRAITLNEVKRIAGKGVSFDEADPTAKQTAEFLDAINADGDDINEILSNSILDYRIFNAIALKITWSRDWTQINSVEHVDFCSVRCAKPEGNGNVLGYWISEDWKQYRPVRQFIPKFNLVEAKQNKILYKQALDNFAKNVKDPNASILDGKNNVQLLVWFPYQPKCKYYPLPDYAGAITSIESDIEADQYALSSLKNGMDPGFIVKFKMAGDNQTRAKNSRDFYRNYTGSKKAGKPLLLYSNNNEEFPEIDRTNSQGISDRYTKINENSLQKILSGHRVTHPLLVGIETPGKLGSGAELPIAENIYISTVINPEQLAIIKVFNKIMKANGMATLSIIPLDPLPAATATPAFKNDGADEGQEEGNNNEIVDPEDLEGKSKEKGQE